MVVSGGTRPRRPSSSDRPRSFPLSALRWYSRNPSSVSRSPATATRSSSASGEVAVTTKRVLDPRTDGRDGRVVEAEPVHPPQVACVLHLEAAVHDHRQAALLGDPGALLVDHTELAPERAGVDRHGVSRDPWQRVRRAEDVHDVHWLWDVQQARVALLPEDLRLARIDRDHAVVVPLEVVTDEVAGPQLVVGQAHDRDRLGCVEYPLDRQRVLVPGEIGHAVATFFCAVAATSVKPCSRSQIRSSTDSVPTDSRTVPGPTPAARSSSSLSCRCVVLAGWMMRLFASPTFARWDQSVMPRIRSCPPSRPLAQSNENTAPAPRGMYFSTSGRYRLDGRAGEGTFDGIARVLRCPPTRSGTVSSPCRNRNALNGESAPPRSRRVSARSFMRYPYVPNVSW